MPYLYNIALLAKAKNYVIKYPDATPEQLIEILRSVGESEVIIRYAAQFCRREK